MGVSIVGGVNRRDFTRALLRPGSVSHVAETQEHGGDRRPTHDGARMRIQRRNKIKAAELGKRRQPRNHRGATSSRYERR